MYTAFFGLNEKPFSITPNPRYLYMSERHTEALAHLIYGIKDGGGFIQLTGEVGTGKTTLIRGLLQRLPENADVALVLNSQLSATEFLAAILEELGIELPEQRDSLKALTDALNEFLLKNYSNGRRTILIVDEAQNFAVDVLEQIRLLTNLETAKHKLLQILLIGQPELRTTLSRHDLRQLAQRITARYHLEALDQDDTDIYIQHRLKVAGATRPIFDKSACRELYRLSGGIPRIINVIADRALLGGFTAEVGQIDAALVRQAASEVYGEDPSLNRGRARTARIALIAGLAALFVGAAVFTAMRLVAPADRNPVTAVSPAAGGSASPAQQAGTPSVPGQVPLTSADNGSVAAAPALVSDNLSQLLLTSADRTATSDAFTQLFALWNVTYTPGPERACEQARDYQLECFFKQGSLAQLERLNRPAILTLQDDLGTSHQVVLTSLGRDDAVLNIGGDTVQVRISDLSRYWFGDYLLLWRPQVDNVRAYYQGMNDPAVPWIRRSLATIQGTPIEPMNSDYFDAGLAARVRDYQIERRLTVDGKVGQQTQIAMNTDLDIGAPQLARLN
ncbi:MAG: AAA family ATPase [Gammaproteobacteria bacterium]|nr:AAA family ATPase [Gammaproteobacteria bacterium]